jgi:hypothetical protein
MDNVTSECCSERGLDLLRSIARHGQRRRRQPGSCNGNCSGERDDYRDSGGVSGTTTVTATAAVLTAITITPPNSSIA